MHATPRLRCYLPPFILRFHASNIQLIVDSDTAYLVLTKTKSLISGFFRLGESSPDGSRRDKQRRTPNGAIPIEWRTLCHIVASTVEAEVSVVYHNAQIILPIKVLLIPLVHPQKPTPIITDKSTEVRFINDNINMKKSKSWDMRLYWLRDRELQSQFKIF